MNRTRHVYLSVMVVFKFTVHRWTPKIDQWSATHGFAKKLQPPFNIHVEKCSEKVDISTLPLHFLHCLFLQIDSEKQFRGSNSVDPQNKEFAFSRNFPKMSHLLLGSEWKIFQHSYELLVYLNKKCVHT